MAKKIVINPKKKTVKPKSRFTVEKHISKTNGTFYQVNDSGFNFPYSVVATSPKKENIEKISKALNLHESVLLAELKVREMIKTIESQSSDNPMGFENSLKSVRTPMTHGILLYLKEIQNLLNEK